MITIIVPARLHIGLISMNSNGYRKNGGIGFAINGFDTKILCDETTNNRVKIVCENNPMLEKELTELVNNISLQLGLRKGINIEITKKPISHNGLGTGTSTKLGCLEALLKINSVQFSKQDLIKLSGRGGTSGIGINTYFRGGLVFDVGRKGGSIKPSNSFNHNSFQQPLVITQTKMPNWDLSIISPRNCNNVSRKEERGFFENYNKIKDKDVHFACYHALFGCVSSVLDTDLSEFSMSLDNFQNTEWKKREWALQDQKLKEYRAIVKEQGINLALSSLGATAFTMTKNTKVLKDALMESSLDAALLRVQPNNIGRTISNV